jgi:hypothetical protein
MRMHMRKPTQYLAHDTTNRIDAHEHARVL